jgi:hypothetical protein
MKNTILVIAFLVGFTVAFTSGLITQRHLGLIGPETSARYSSEQVMNLSRSSYIEGYYAAAEAALAGRFEVAGDSAYKEALTWRLNHPSFPFITEEEPK